LPKNKLSQYKKQKFRLLIDSAFAKPEFFPKLKLKTNLAHCVHDLGLSPQTEDIEIYKNAITSNRFVLTINYRHFRKLVKPGKPGVFAIESELSNKEIDETVTKFLSGKDPKDFIGKSVKI